MNLFENRFIRFSSGRSSGHFSFLRQHSFARLNHFTKASEPTTFSTESSPVKRDQIWSNEDHLNQYPRAFRLQYMSDFITIRSELNVIGSMTALVNLERILEI